MNSSRTLFFQAGSAALFVMTLLGSQATAQTPTPTPAPPLPMQTPKPSALKPPAPFPADAKIAFINLEIVFEESELGKAGQARWRGLTEKLFNSLTAKEKEIQTLSDKIKNQQSTAGEAVLKSWSLDLARMQREHQFAQQEARAQSEQLQQEVLGEFGKKVQPVIDALRAEKGLHAILSVQRSDGGLTLLSVEPGVDLSAELVKRLNAAK